jgi:TatD DNase family protein
MAELIDSHAHLQEPEFEEDLDEVLAAAREAGLIAVVVPGEDATTSERAVLLAQRYAGVYAAAGFHPHEASHLTDEGLARVEQLLDHPLVVAVGEIGLDFYRMHSPREAQIEALTAQLALAARKRRPVIIHCRDAWEALAEALVPWARQAGPAFGGRPLGVLHYFSGSLAEARRYIDLGFLISIHTAVTHPKSQQLREVAAALPLEYLVVETDSPYGAPQSRRGRRNEPACVVEAAREIAALKGVGFEDVAAATTANAMRLFGLGGPADGAEASSQHTSADEAEASSLLASGGSKKG